MCFQKVSVAVLTGLAVFICGCAAQDIDVPGRTPNAAQLLHGQSDNKQLPKLDTQSTIDDYLAYAALNNPGLKAAFNRWKAALEQAPQVTALPDPRFTYRYFVHEIETRVGAQHQAFELSQTFPWLDKLEIAGDIAGKAAQARRQLYEQAKLRLFFDVKDAYYEYYYLAKAVNVTRENVDLMTHLESVARTKYKGAAGSHPDVIRAQVELGKIDDRLRSLLDLRQPMMARLNQALNRAPEAELPWPTTIDQSRVLVSDGQLLSWLGESNRELQALGLSVEQYRQSVELANKDYLPDITLGASFTDIADSTGGRDPSDDGKNAVAGMISVNIPIWRQKCGAVVREAQAQYHASILERQDRLNTLGSELQLALYRWRDAQRKIDLYGGALLPKAAESLKVTEAAFRSAKGSFLDLIDAQRVYLEFELAHERALADHEQSLAKIEMLVGRELPPAAN